MQIESIFVGGTWREWLWSILVKSLNLAEPKHNQEKRVGVQVRAFFSKREFMFSCLWNCLYLLSFRVAWLFSQKQKRNKLGAQKGSTSEPTLLLGPCQRTNQIQPQHVNNPQRISLKTILVKSSNGTSSSTEPFKLVRQPTMSLRRQKVRKRTGFRFRSWWGCASISLHPKMSSLV
jgi:hypothetical protein